MKENIKKIIDFVEWKEQMKLVINHTAMSKLGNNVQFETKYPELFSKLKSFYKQLVPLKFDRGCNSCWADRYFEITQISINKIINIMNCTAKLKEGVVIQYKGKFYSNKSPHMTNEIAAELYKIRPNDFESFDADWKEKVITPQDLQKEIDKQGMEKYFEKDLVPEIETKEDPKPETETKEKPILLTAQKPKRKAATKKRKPAKKAKK